MAPSRSDRRSQTISPLQHLLFDLITSDKTPSASPTRNKLPASRQFLANDPGFEARLRQAAIAAHTHLSLRRDVTRQKSRASEVGGGKHGKQAENPNKDFRIEDGASHVSTHPDTADIERLDHDFIGHRGRIRLRRIDGSPAQSGGTGGTFGNQNDESDEEQDILQPREVMKVSVADISISPDLPHYPFACLNPHLPDIWVSLNP